MPADEITEQKTFRTRNDFVDDLDDEEQISAELVQAGVDRAADSNDKGLDEDEVDREFSLNAQANETTVFEDEEDDEFEEEDDDDFEDLPHREALKADHDY